MAKFELHIEADSYGEFKFAVMDVAHGLIEGEAKALLNLKGAAPTRCQPGKAVEIWKEESAPLQIGDPPELPEKKEEKAAVPGKKKAAVPEEKKAAVPGLERPPKLGAEKKKIDPDVVKAALKAGWTQAKIAKEYGVTQSAISQIVKKYGW